jgi:uncharacterized protein
MTNDTRSSWFGSNIAATCTGDGDDGRRQARRQARDELSALTGDLHLAAVTDDLIVRAADLADDEGLRGYDAVHLAAALHLGASILTSADEALCDAAGRNGMHVANPLVD